MIIKKKRLNIKMVLIILSLVVISVLIPLFIDNYIIGNYFPSFWSDSDWSGFLGSYIGGILGGLATLLSIYITTIETRNIERNKRKQDEKEKDKKEKILNRGYILTEEINNLGLRLEGYNCNGDIRILETDNYTEFEKYAYTEKLENIKLNYLKIKNVGPNLVTNCQFKLIITETDSNKEYIIEKAVPMIQINQEIFIMAQSSEFLETLQLLTSVEISYITTVGEEILYKYNVENEERNRTCIETYYTKEDNNYKELFSTNVEPVSWIHTNHYRTTYKK